MGLRDAITKVVRDKAISDFEFVRPTKWEGVLNQIAERFLCNGSRDLKSIWLWLSFRDPIITVQPDNPMRWLRDCLDPSMEYWFIATEEDGKYWIASATGAAVIKVIEEMYGFEYYVVDREMGWMLCENHHGVFIRSNQATSTLENAAQ
ncbi:MAG: DUF6756 family protein [Verrucomicrobiota bacterium]